MALFGAGVGRQDGPHVVRVLQEREDDNCAWRGRERRGKAPTSPDRQYVVDTTSREQLADALNHIMELQDVTMASGQPLLILLNKR